MFLMESILQFKVIEANKGFSLVELSVVIVLISLIVASILGGKSLLRQSQLKTVFADYQKYKNGYDAFKLKFRAVPGDFKDAIAYNLSVKNGDGDSILENLVYNSNGRTPEADNAFIHLQRTGIVDSSVEEHLFGVSQWGILGLHYPAASISEKVGIRFTSAGGFYNGMASCPFYGKVRDINVLTFWSRFVTPAEAYAMDIKTDDGAPDGGNMFASNGIGPPSSSNYNVAGNRCVDFGLCHSGSPVYVVGETENRRCYLIFSLGK